jgi:hypothetical protein
LIDILTKNSSRGMVRPLLNALYPSISSNISRMRISSYMRLEPATGLLRGTFSTIFEKSIQRSMTAPNTISLKSVVAW